MQKPITNIFFILAFLLLFPMTAFSAADPLASEKAKSTLNYISGLSSLSANKVVSGQFSGGQHYISSECTDVFNLTGYWPGMIGVNYSPIYGGSESDFTQINNLIINYSNSGGLVHIFMHSRNPVTNKFFNSDGSKDTTNVDFVQLVTNGSALNTAWKKELDRVAVGLSQLRDNNVVVLFRPFHEMNGSWFWWGAKDYTQFKNAWIYTFNYLTTTKGLHNLLWFYGPNSGGDAGINGYYPGSQYVDMTGLDIYSSMDITQVAGYTALVALNKPLGLGEFGPCAASGSGCTPPSDSRLLIAGIRDHMPKIAFWMSYSDMFAISSHNYATQLLQDSWVVTRDEIPSFDSVADTTAPSAPSGLRVL